MSDAQTLTYLNAVDAALRSNEERDTPLITTTRCAECEGVVGVDLNPADHWILFDTEKDELVVVIGCEGYWQVDPSAVGIESEHWSGIPGINV